VSTPRISRWVRVWLGDSHDVPQVRLDQQPGRSEVTAEIIAHVLSRPDSIRQRAQNAATISGALAAALVVAAVSGLTDGSGFVTWLTTVLVCLAILFFALSAVLSVYAVAFPHEYQPGDLADADHYQQLVEDYENYADEVRQKMRRAAAAAFVAVSLTAVALVIEIAARVAADDTQAVTVLLSPGAAAAVEELCAGDDALSARIVAQAPPGELVKPVVELTEVQTELSSPRARQSSQLRCEGTITLPRAAIRAAFARE
jgi:hypothetical protein